MKFQMKNFRFAALFLVFSVSAAFTACQPEEEPEPADSRDPFVASWTCSETSSEIGAVSPYTVHINKSTTADADVLIENFYNMGFPIKATASISGTIITIPQQTFNSTYQLHGSGSKTGANTINLTYYMNDGSTIDTCVATYTRQ
jgi:hypothetical protein